MKWLGLTMRRCKCFVYLCLILFFVSSCNNGSDDSYIKRKVVKLEQIFPDYNLLVGIYSSEETDKVGGYYNIMGYIKVDCHSCEENKKYLLTNVHLCSNEVRFSLPMLRNTIASVVPAVIYKRNKRFYKFEVMWSSINFPPYLIDVNSLKICIAEPIKLKDMPVY